MMSQPLNPLQRRGWTGSTANPRRNRRDQRITSSTVFARDLRLPLLGAWLARCRREQLAFMTGDQERSAW